MLVGVDIASKAFRFWQKASREMQRKYIIWRWDYPLNGIHNNVELNNVRKPYLATKDVCYQPI